MIVDYLKAGFPAILLQTQEPHRADELLRSFSGWQTARWDCVFGVCGIAPQSFTFNEILNPVEALNWLSSTKDTVLTAHGLHYFLDDPAVCQTMLNGILRWKSTGNCLVMISPSQNLPLQLQPFFHLIEMKLPDEEALLRLQSDLASTSNIRTNRKASRLATGLTEFQAETAYSLSLVKKGYFSSKVITEAKTQMIKKSGLLELYPPADMQSVGGLQRLKSYIQNRAQAYLPDSTLPKPKGILLVGIPGTGKSLSARAVASMLDFPLLRLDIGQLKNSLVGESERRIREATKIIDAFGNCVLFLDEIEKMFGGVKGSGSSDGGTTSGMFSHFLTWMNEQNKAFSEAIMSHIAKIQLQIKDLNVLKAACERLNLRFVENQKTYAWYGKVVHPEDLKLHPEIIEEQLGKCDHAIQVPTAKLGYEIGVVKHKDEYILLFDDWDEGLRKTIGHHGELLKQIYTAEAVKAQAKRHNYFYSEKKVDNTLRITLTAF